MEKGRDEENVQEREEESLARIRERNNEDFERFGRFRFSNINEENGGPSSQRQTKRKKVIYHAINFLFSSHDLAVLSGGMIMYYVCLLNLGNSFANNKLQYKDVKVLI